MNDVAAQGVNALVPLIIDNIRTGMMPFRLLNLKLEEELQAEMILNPRSIVSNMISNNLCQLGKKKYQKFSYKLEFKIFDYESCKLLK